MNNTEQHIILKDRRKLGFAEYGSVDGFPIVYCHGSQSSRLEMHYDLSFAIENDLRIITVDRPGHGISDFNPEGSMLSFAKDVKQLSEHLKIDRFSVVGMSAGSPFALAIAYLFPVNVQRAAVISGFVPYTSDSKKHLTKEVQLLLGLAKSFPFLIKLLLGVQAKQLSKNSKKALQNFLKIMSEPDQEVLKNESVMHIIENMFREAYRNGSQGVAYEISKLLVKEWGFELGDIEIPVTLWHGEKDNNVPYQWAKLMRDEIDNAILTIYPNEGHLIIFKHAQEIFMGLKQGVV